MSKSKKGRKRTGLSRTAAKTVKRFAEVSELPANEEIGATEGEQVSREDRRFLKGCMWGAAGGNFVLQVGTMSGLFPGMGWVAAAGLVLAEMGTGYGIEVSKDRSTRGLLLAVLIGFGILEALLPLIREVQVHQQAVQHATETTTVEAPTQCQREVMPAGLNSYRIKAWNEGAAERNAAYQTCLDNERTARQDARTTDRGTLVEAASEHSVFETPARMLFGLLVSLAIGLMARALRGRK